MKISEYKDRILTLISRVNTTSITSSGDVVCVCVYGTGGRGGGFDKFLEQLFSH